MTTQNYLMIQENVVTNLCVWDGDTSTWQPPTDALMLVYSQVPTKVWTLNDNKTEYVLVEIIGASDIGFTWDGTVCTTNKPKPTQAIAADGQPKTSGTQEI